ncbi:DNA alkylation repair protein [Saccharicrinis sp. GN24d3]|uniref:DNA alkylation repair protein n=1 Tax=Saccharicrinis sp. GN24d3 TaxID=3458416 RepID=UPI004036D581
MKFYLQDDTSGKVDDIIRRLNKLMDGDVSIQMKEHGLEYRVNYGASVLWLRNMAKQYSGDNELADRLWHREIRETMILATLIADNISDNKKRIEDWALLLGQNEIAEQLGANLLWRMPEIKNTAESWLKGNNKHLKDSVWTGLAVFLQRGGEMDESEMNKYLDLMEQSFMATDKFTLRVQGRFLRQLCRKSNAFMNSVDQFVDHVKKHPNCAWLIEDVQTEIKFLKDSSL